MFRVRGRCVGGRIELDSPVPLTDGTPVEVVVQPVRDAVYDDWKKLYGPPG